MASQVLVAGMDADLIIGSACNRSCIQCFGGEYFRAADIAEELALAKILIADNPDWAPYVYTSEITLQPQLLDLISRIGQSYVLTNGLLLTREPGFLDRMVDLGFEKIKTTLFSNPAEQRFWYRTTDQQYDDIMKGIELARSKGLRVEVFTIVSALNIIEIPDLHDLVSALGVEKLSLLPITPLGRARSLDSGLFLQADDVEKLMGLAEPLKQAGMPYISYGISFGPDFYGSSVWDYLDGSKAGDWTTSRTLCPAIDSRYIGIKTRTRELVWCFKLMDEPEYNIGSVRGNAIDITGAPDLSPDTLKKELKGICAADRCSFQEECLGGCRSTALAYSRLQGQPDIYAGMPFCRTEIKSRLGSKQGE